MIIYFIYTIIQVQPKHCIHNITETGPQLIGSNCIEVELNLN